MFYCMYNWIISCILVDSVHDFDAADNHAYGDDNDDDDDDDDEYARHFTTGKQEMSIVSCIDFVCLIFSHTCESNLMILWVQLDWNRDSTSQMETA